MSRLMLRVRVGAEGMPFTLQGRDAWFLQELMKVGETGLTAMQYPGARISHYCMKCRRAGLLIDCEDEAHDGPFKGSHGRYRLRSQVEIVPMDAERRAA